MPARGELVDFRHKRKIKSLNFGDKKILDFYCPLEVGSAAPYIFMSPKVQSIYTSLLEPAPPEAPPTKRDRIIGECPFAC